ncbi:S8 family peptidase [Niallia taxi]|uniref:S8 family peptidase n=1 Tax=Niallia taxi TaxID=2499688 RepID=UPI00203EE41A|nr:S8 family serine peptidase [Niallia taxi]MCM3216090.1 S8 family peptidase [Niallia taxi]
MDTYLLKCQEHDSPAVQDFVLKNNGTIVYSSPILPIISVSIDDFVKQQIEREFNLEYIIKDPVGKLQDVEGNVTSITKNNTLNIVPSLNFSKLRNSNYIGWGATVGVIDSGVSESWVSEQYDFTGYGTTPHHDHGTKVANIIKSVAQGAKINSYKVTQDGRVSGTHFFQAVDAAIQKVDILNLSLGFDTTCSPDQLCPFCEYVNYYTQNEGKLFIVAAGNHGLENSVQCPGRAQDAITVGAIKGYANELADYSSRGVPGIKKPNILTSGTIYFNHEQCEGTSFATPVITGVCTTVFPKLSKDIAKTKSFLYESAIDIGLPEHHQGFGLFDLDKFMEVLLDGEINDTSKGQEQN